MAKPARAAGRFRWISAKKPDLRGRAELWLNACALRHVLGHRIDFGFEETTAPTSQWK
jgi:hypothetical protein